LKKPNAVLCQSSFRRSIECRHTEVAARVDSKSNLGSVVVSIRGSLGATKRTGLVGTADIELVVVASEGSEILGLDLDARELANDSYFE
jgi:hypothetical protein